jgi:hypothetical protein
MSVAWVYFSASGVLAGAAARHWVATGEPRSLGLTVVFASLAGLSFRLRRC